MITATVGARQSCLMYASRFTPGPADPAAVAVNAAPLVAWLEGARDVMDGRARLEAMSQQHCNYPGLPRRVAELGLMDNPAEFVRRAQVLYDFATAGEAQ